MVQETSINRNIWAVGESIRSGFSKVPSPRHLSQVLLALISSPPPNRPNNHQSIDLYQSHCPKDPILSCPSEKLPREDLDTCCVNHPSGLFLQTQFWDTNPSLGPNNSWTIHGLWPDLCTGGFQQYCDRSREHQNITDVLLKSSHESSKDLLQFMNEYWLSLDSNNEHLWSHEWNKHGTCISTLDPPCYSDADAVDEHKSRSTIPGFQDVHDYFTHTVSLFQTLDTFATLAKANIIPSTTETYTLASIQAAISTSHEGHQVMLRCNQHRELDEVWYYFAVRGSLRLATAQATHRHFIPTSPLPGMHASNCPVKGIKYLPKSRKHVPNPHPAPPPRPGKPFEGKGFLKIHVKESHQELVPAVDGFEGCLIRPGTWYTSGACAAYRAKTDATSTHEEKDEDPSLHLFTLSSSYAPCAIDLETSEFRCAKDLGIQTIFSASVSDGDVLAYKNRTTFFAEKIPGRFEKVAIYADDGDGSRSIALEIRWADI